MTRKSMTELSTSAHDESTEWPINAIPRRWVEALFAKMSAFYGSRFADLWRGTDHVAVLRAWAIELHKLTAAQMKAGSDSLSALTRPPSLPEFVEHCRRLRAEQAAVTVPMIEISAPADLAVINSNLAQLQRITRSTRLSSAHPGWAYDALHRGAGLNGSALTVEVRKHCRDAIFSPVGMAYLDGQRGDHERACREVLADLVGAV